MGFTVTYPGGTKDSEFQAYVRLLRRNGLDINHLPRVPEPGTNRRWLYAWQTAEQAEQFAKELRAETGDPKWEARETPAEPSPGALGSIIIQLNRTGEGFTFGLPPLSRFAVERARPDARFLTSAITVERENWDKLRAGGASFHELVRMVIPALTGLPADRLDELGYAVVDTDAGETVDRVVPAPLNHAPAAAGG